MARLAVDGDKSIYYEDHGAGEQVLMLVHGWGMSGRVWDGVLIPLLAAGLRVITFDHRGCGRSDHDFADMGIEAIASDAVALADHLKLDRMFINGWSLGGAVAVAAADTLGSRCRGLVLTAGATPIYTQKPDLALGGTAADVAGTVAAIDADRINVLSQLAHAVCAKPVTVEQTAWMASSFLASSARASRTLGELGELDQRATLAQLTVPILSYICGQDGFVAPDISRWVADNHPMAKGIEYPDSGHAPFIEEREAYIESLLDFIETAH